jgi:hypothetical protein
VKARWRASSNGPDWTDVRVIMGDIEATHHCSCYVGLTPCGGTKSGTWCISVMAVLPVLLDGLEAAVCVVQRDWPNAENSTLEGCVYRMLHEIDWAIGSECYVQTSF